jgi:hypothetical protein
VHWVAVPKELRARRVNRYEVLLISTFMAFDFGGRQVSPFSPRLASRTASHPADRAWAYY